MAEKTYSFGYELKSKQVRKYRVSNQGRVRQAIAANIQEYMTYQGVVEDEPASTKEMVITVGVSLLGISAGLFLKTASALALPFMGGVFVVFSLFLVQGMLQGNNNQVFLGSGVFTVKPGSPNHRALTRLKGKRLAVHLEMTPGSTSVTLSVHIVGRSRMFAPARLIHSVEKTVCYGKYFSSTGYFFPPPLKADIDSALAELSRC